MRYHLESTLPIHAFNPLGGRHSPFKHGMTLEGGGGGGIISAITDPISSALGTDGGGGGVLGALADVDKAVGDTVPGGWGTIAAVAVPYLAPELIALQAGTAAVPLTATQAAAVAAGTSAATGAIRGDDPEDILKNAALAGASSYGLNTLFGDAGYVPDEGSPYIDGVPPDSYRPNYVPDEGSPYIDGTPPPDYSPPPSYTPDEASPYIDGTPPVDVIPPELNLGSLYRDLPDGATQLGYSPEVLASSTTPTLSEEELKEKFFNDLINKSPNTAAPIFDYSTPADAATQKMVETGYLDRMAELPGATYDMAKSYVVNNPYKSAALGLGALSLANSGQQPQPQGQYTEADSRYRGGYGSSGGVASPYLLRNRVTASNIYDYENPYDRYGSVNRRYAKGGEVKHFAFGGISNALTRAFQPIEKAIVQPVGQALPFLKDVAPYAGILAAPFITNPAMAVGVGALSSGFGRPGTGFDMKRALMGGIAAYGASTLGAGIEAAGTEPTKPLVDTLAESYAVPGTEVPASTVTPKGFFRDTDAMQRGVGNLLSSDSDAATKAFGTKASIFKSGVPIVMGTSGMMAIDEANKMREEAELAAGPARQSQADMLARIAKGKKRAEEAVRANPYMYAMGGQVDDELGGDYSAMGMDQGNMQKGLFGMGYAEGGLLASSPDLVKAQTLPFTGTPSNLPANYQEARQAFEKAQQTEMENYRNAPYDPNRIIPGIGVAMIGYDQFGQQFGSATDADKFDKFYKLYNQTQGPSAPVGNAPQLTPVMGPQPTPDPINNLTPPPIGGGSAGTPIPPPPAGSNRAAYESFYASQPSRGGLTSLLGSLNASNVYDRMARLPPIMQRPMQLRQQFAPQGGLRGLAQPNRFSLFNRNMPTRRFAEGGTPRFLSGGGDGMSDSIKANIDGTQEARLADGEFVIPADVVSHLGNGSSKAGAKQLYSMMDRVREARTGNKKQGRQIKPTKLMPA
jgi:hypothetical protein